MAAGSECSDFAVALDSDWQKLYQHLSNMQERQREMLAIVQRPRGVLTKTEQEATSSFEGHFMEAEFSAEVVASIPNDDPSGQAAMPSGTHVADTVTDTVKDTVTDAVADTVTHKVTDSGLNTRFKLSKNVQWDPECDPSAHGTGQAFRSAYAARLKNLSGTSEFTQMEAYFGRHLSHSSRCWRSVLHAVVLFSDKFLHCCFKAEPKRDSRCARFVDGWFNDFCQLTIVLNVLLLVYTTDQDMAQPLGNPAGTEIRHVEFEKGFTVIYFIEMVAKIAVHRLYFFSGKQCWWNLLDMMLVAVSVYDLIVTTNCDFSLQGGDIDEALPCRKYGWEADIVFLRLLRIFKVTKVFRVARLMRSGKYRIWLVKSRWGRIKDLFW
eukprot:TRINITY_DN43387_c0_g1_i1.p1 TRINITY_DN43387_c0_g1~~TRINITY_DN43387_c0_g1_i1.p1  ORF type:complete len:379 (-),score=41.95 TRINITY_DN43387_c0_g1_i1:38-1174(-)